ncbi:MAG: PD-(D/E)XK nuclease family protein [Sandaracinaceae bacterium]|nr:PD-(D/E)XK nuclease family protein [Sandaracinaceae bacterium]
MNPRRALNLLLSSPELHAFEARLRHVSAFHVLGIETWEKSHAALLAWLLDPRASHGMGVEALRRFLLLAAQQSGDSMLDAVDVDQLDLTDVIVETEVAITVPGSSKPRRLDVLVSATLLGIEQPTPIAIIEYKVDADEGEEQTADYARWAAGKTLTLGDRAVMPLQVYLCPAVHEDAAPAPPFVTIGYDAYLGWLDAVRELEMTRQAEFLLAEWRACLAVRNDVVDPEQEELRQALEEKYADALAVLRTASAADKKALGAVLRQHDVALAQLGVAVGGRSKGYSATVAVARESLAERLAEPLWLHAGGEGSLISVFRPFVEAVAEMDGTQVRRSGLRLQVFAERPKRGRFAIVLEVIGERAGGEGPATRELRRGLADDLRARLREVDPALPFSQNATVLRFTIATPQVREIDTDTVENVEPQRGEIVTVVDRLATLEPIMSAWCATAVGTRLSENSAQA